VGAIRFSKRNQNYKYEVRAIKDLVQRVIPHFQKYPLKTSKTKDFELFVEICKLVSSNHHLNPNYLEEIINKAYQMNESGKRRYKKRKLLKLMSR